VSLTYIRNFIQLLFIPTSYGFPTARGKARAFPQLVGYGFPGIFVENVSSTTRVRINKTFKK